MANKKSGNDGRKPPYIHARNKDEMTVQLSCRIPGREKDRFDKAVGRLRESGEDMQVVDIVRNALAEAADYVERHYGKPKTPSPTNVQPAG